jgi:hypothetical protein
MDEGVSPLFNVSVPKTSAIQRLCLTGQTSVGIGSATTNMVPISISDQTFIPQANRHSGRYVAATTVEGVFSS